MTRLMTAVYLALMIAPFIALAATAPYVMLEYRRTKMIHVPRCAQLYLMLFFLLCAYFMTMLPFPSMESVRAMTNTGIQLIPFYCFYDFFVNSALVVSDWTTIFPALSGSIFLGIVFNVIMLMPVGFFMHSLFRISPRRAAAIGFGISLFFELTQLSGLFFIYPRPYRVFDVDDLMQNTLGLWLGFMAQPLFAKIMPSARSRQIVQQGGEVSMRRRILADCIDHLLCAGGTVLALLALSRFLPVHTERHAFVLFMTLYMVATLLVALVIDRTHGRSLGMLATGLELRAVRRSGKRLRYVQCALRCAVSGFLFLLPFVIHQLIRLSTQMSLLRSVVCVFLSAVCVFLYVRYLLELFLNFVTHGTPLIFEKLSRTRLGLHPNARSIRRLRVLYTGHLTENAIEPGADSIFRLLCEQGIDKKKSLRVQYMAQGILLDWMNRGLRERFFDVQMDERFFHKTIVISIPGPEVPLNRDDGSYVELLSGTRLSFDAYYTGGANVFAIDVPD